MMASTEPSNERMDALQELMDRLSSPDLTLCEAKVVRGRLLALTGEDQEPGTVPEMTCRVVSCDGQRNGPRLPGCRHFAA